MRSTADKRPGQPSSAASLNASGSGEGKRWRTDHMRYPNPARERSERLVAPTLASTRSAVEPDFAIVVGPRGGRKREQVGVEVTHAHPLAKHNLRAAYAAFATECSDSAVARYCDMAARGRTAQADGAGNKLRAWQDRPRRQRYAAHSTSNAPRQPKPAKAERPSAALAVCTTTPTHGPGCMCFPCLLGK